MCSAACPTHMLCCVHSAKEGGSVRAQFRMRLQIYRYAQSVRMDGCSRRVTSKQVGQEQQSSYSPLPPLGERLWPASRTALLAADTRNQEVRTLSHLRLLHGLRYGPIMDRMTWISIVSTNPVAYNTCIIVGRKSVDKLAYMNYFISQ